MTDEEKKEFKRRIEEVIDECVTGGSCEDVFEMVTILEEIAEYYDDLTCETMDFLSVN